MPQPISPDEITQLITQGIPDAEVKIQDLTGGGDHYEALVISASFDGKMKVARHRMVYGSLQDAMVERIHALKLSTLTPQEFEAQASELMSIQPGKTDVATIGPQTTHRRKAPWQTTPSLRSINT